MTSPVTKGQTIKVAPESQWIEINIEWSQNLSSRSGTYLKADFENLSPGTESGLSVFIQKDKVQEFKNISERDGESFRVVVNDAFLYGQVKGGQKRWLVYHDKNRQPYQHRFVQGVLTRLGNGANEFAKSFGLGEGAQAITSTIKSIVGDPLRAF